MKFITQVKNKIKEFPIGAWVPYYKEDLNLEYLKEIKESGINFIPTIDCTNETLDLFKEAGLHALVNDDRVVYANVAKIHSINEYVKEYVKHDAYFMNFVWDEPSPLMMNICGTINKEVEKTDDEAIGYINLHPNYSDQVTQRCGLSYKEYLEYFIKKAQPSVLSFDNYPFYNEKIDTNKYLENLKDISDISMKYDIPFVDFIQSASFFNNRIVNKAEISYLINTSIAFGAKGYLYFTYKEVTHENNFGYGLVDKNNKKTLIYDYAKEINTKVKETCSYLIDAEYQGVKLYNKELDYLTNINKDINFKGNNFIIGFYKKEQKEYRYITNLDYENRNSFMLDNQEYSLNPGEAIIL